MDEEDLLPHPQNKGRPRNAGGNVRRGVSLQRRGGPRTPNETSQIQSGNTGQRARSNSTSQRHHPIPGGSGQANSNWPANRNHHGGNHSNLYASADDVRSENANLGRNRRNYAGAGPNRNNKDKNRYPMGFKALEELSLSDSKDILEKINTKRIDFLDLVGRITESKDLFVLVIEILSKVGLSSFDELKQKLLLDVINSQFLINLTNYLVNLHYTTTRDKDRNKLYWNNQSTFWQNFITFSESIFNVAPSVAMQKWRPLLDICKLSLGELNARHQFVLSDENEKRFTELRGRMTEFEQKEEEKKCRVGNKNDSFDERDPPENFRELSVVPSCDDLLGQKPFLRANVVQGGYADVEHYLDVQFRLLREDCFGPLREGLQQYVENPARQKYDNIRVYRNVRVYGPFVSKTQAGVTIQLDENTMKRFKRINWSHSKRFIFGSLLLFTNDNCRSFLAATIIDRDPKNLTAGRISVNIIKTAEASVSEQLNNDAVYVMIESEVYFEPYQHVLKALRDPRFPEKLAMSKYIVNVAPQATPPAYLNDSSQYCVKKRSFTVLQPDTWPSCEQLTFDESQYEAFKLALTHEFSVIQGPPGTGKTYLGAHVAKTLLTNIQIEQRCLMLIICYTNHALDQFLERILKVTNSIVRVGGQSRNPAMEPISLNNVRRSNNSRINNTDAMNLYHSERHNLRMIMTELQIAQNHIESLHDGVLSYECMKEYIPEVAVLQKYYNVTGGDIIRNWLFQNTPYLDVHQILQERTDERENLPLYTDNEYEENARTGTSFDDPWFNEIDISGVKMRTSFCLNDAEQKLKQLIANYRNSKNRHVMESFEFEIRCLYSYITLFKEMKQVYKTTGEREIKEGENLKRLPNADRWCLYFTWTSKVITSVKEEIKPLQEKVNTAMATYEEARMILDLKLIKGRKVVGMTTSGAARLRKLLEALAPPIVIVEEAAEVLEQHIVTALPSSCKHLILIGDHQQLRPSPAYIKLARHFNYDVSLFERMINNGMHSRRLGVQHRMRPEIAALISPHIYKDLANHPSVHAFPHVRGVTTDLFFFTHDYKEEAVEDSASRSNNQEADMTLALANYIMQQGYQPEDVTVLTAYTGQMFYMRQQRHKYVFLENVKITVVDSYQGEESKIILLSLVRNNDQNKIGFLGTENRICVALSRAKEGFYIFGNINILTENSGLWSNIAKTLEDVGSIGSELRLKCENHDNTFTQITSIKDFEEVPEGGCLLKCNYNLPACGHPCPRICHAYDLEHSKVECFLDCERVICELRHPCPLKCGEKCGPCKQRIVKTLPCGHPKEVYCHQEPINDPTIMCTTTVTVELTVCGHTAEKPCHLDLKKAVCKVPCKYRVECGHECRLNCHVGNDPDHERYECQKQCAKAKRGCTANLEGDRGEHQCSRRCHEACEDCNVEVMKKRANCKHSDRVKCSQDVNEKPCRKNCARAMTCGHFCKKKCFEPCGDCNQKVTKIIPECKHKIKLVCKEEAKQELCRERCERRLPCGHKCTKRCGQKCDEKACMQIIERELASPCGHQVKLPCSVFNQGFSDPELVMKYCTVPCNTTLKCEHVCRGTCSWCFQGRLHVACAQPCHVPMICGHQCEEPCNSLCPPCKKPCEVKCVHSQCKKICGATCVPCQEPCARQCPHGRCGRRCGERCARAACDARCPRALRCGHPCRGLCGEPCPDICRVCRPDDFPKDFLGDDFEEDAKFIQLQDCPHVLEVEDADNLMQGDKETITIHSCPFCRKPVINTYRYKDLVNEMYRTEINPIKERVYGTEAQVVEKRNKLSETLSDFEKNHMNVLAENLHLRLAFKKVKVTFLTQKKASMLQLDMHFLYIEILARLVNYYKQFKDAKLTELKDEFSGQIRLMSDVLTRNIQKISQQQQEDIGRELKRMNSMIQLSKMLSQSSYLSTEVTAAAKDAKSIIISNRIYIEHIAVDALKKLQETVKLTGIASREERALVIKAIGLKQGHWFRCPNGHIYCIGECGGAMQVSKCIECNAPVGGQSHQLLPSNAHAGDIDGSRFPAWSNHNNNMANFDLRNIN